mmetsp:Transcript_28146/g.70619  ORF Transcript_28146/g.70619 Transcript_28146/m.70619 type:complete len:274 (-) Transcript_28146:56-877(-)
MGIHPACIIDTLHVPEELKCRVCFEVCKDPVQTKTNYVFCHECITRTVEATGVCPLTRIPILSREISSLSQANPVLFRIWSGIKVRCVYSVARGCDWTGDLADLVEHYQICGGSNYQEPNGGGIQMISSEAEIINELRAELDDTQQRSAATLLALRNDLDEAQRCLSDTCDQIIELRRKVPELRHDYSYNRNTIVELTQLIVADLESKPPHYDSQKIFNCIKNCKDDFVKNWSDNPKHINLDLYMLLAVCRASCTWFSDKQRGNINVWLESIF